MITSVKSRGELVFAGLTLALGIFILIGTSFIHEPVAASNVGPRFFPYAIGILLTAASAFVVLDVLRGNSAAPEEGELVDPSLPMNKKRVVLLLISILAFAVLLEPAGYVIACAVSFFGIAVTLGARLSWRVAVTSVALSLAIYLLFTRPLGIYLPPGVLAGIL
ncbi:tripartite tricarboxylate transporter TctB family protein [Pseudarthrobacter sp. NPDC058119]|uniref:tripartite tricarboxylate transporter TctB family protein n=1 Tax=Pseudarthrobacter sp. NPDC058119 TaxID=3346348 RepID=UPI0036DC901B